MLKTKAILANTLIEILKTKKYKDITITDIVSQAKISRSTYYRNFSSKEDVILFYLNDIFKIFSKQILKQKNLTFETYLNLLFRHYFNYKNELILIYNNELFHLFSTSVKKIFEVRNFKYLNLKNHYKIQYHSGGISNFFSFWISREMIETPEEVSKIALSFYPDELKNISYFN